MRISKRLRKYQVMEFILEPVLKVWISQNPMVNYLKNSDQTTSVMRNQKLCRLVCKVETLKCRTRTSVLRNVSPVSYCCVQPGSISEAWPWIRVLQGTAAANAGSSAHRPHSPVPKPGSSWVMLSLVHSRLFQLLLERTKAFPEGFNTMFGRARFEVAISLTEEICTTLSV